MPKLYIAYNGDATAPLVVTDVLALTSARKHLKVQNIRVLSVDLGEDGRITRRFDRLENYEAEQRLMIAEKLDQLKMEKRRLQALLVAPQ